MSLTEREAHETAASVSRITGASIRAWRIHTGGKLVTGGFSCLTFVDICNNKNGIVLKIS